MTIAEMTGKVICGDCLDVMREMPDGCVDAVITDPPYEMRGGNVPIRGKGVTKPTIESYSLGEPWGYSLNWVDEILRLHPSHVIVFCNSYMIGDVSYLLKQQLIIGAVFVWKKPNAPPNIRNTPRWDCEFIVWAKSKTATNERAKEFRSQVLEIPFLSAGCFASERILNNGNGTAAHPTQKPVSLVQIFADRLTSPNALILDPFLGSGTTAVAAIRTGRRFIGIEISPEYCAIAQRRIDAELAQTRIPL